MRRYIPQQHGAWAMLLLPFLMGMAAAQPGWAHALLLCAWVLGYLLTYPLLQWVRTGRGAPYRGPVRLYGALLAPLVATLVWLFPWLFWYGLLMLPMLAVNLWYAKQNRERALGNDLVAVLQFSLMVFMAWGVGGGEDPALAVRLFLVSLAYFAGTVLYVKTLIREKGNRHYYLASVLFHLLLVVGGMTLGPPFTGAALVLAARAVITPGLNLPVKKSGMLEILYAVLLLVVVMT